MYHQRPAVQLTTEKATSIDDLKTIHLYFQTVLKSTLHLHIFQMRQLISALYNTHSQCIHTHLFSRIPHHVCLRSTNPLHAHTHSPLYTTRCNYYISLIVSFHLMALNSI